MSQVEDAVLDAGRTVWPDVTVPVEAMRQHLALHQVDGDTARARAGDLYLAAGCAAGIASAVAAFERTYLPQVGRYVGKLVLSSDQADEVRQRLRIKFLVGPPPRIALYNGLSPLGAYLRVAAVHIALDLVATTGPRPSEASVEDLAAELGAGVAGRGRHPAGGGLAGARDDAELMVIRRRYLPMFQAALEAAIHSLTARDKTLLRLNLIDGLGVAPIGTMYRVHRATAARWLVDIRRRLFASVREQLALDLAASPSELRSLFAMVQPVLHASVSRLLLTRA
jgi:RNA polymerase sigma-70 factor (ECF subfamily)